MASLDMKTLFEKKTFEDEWFTDLRKPAGMSDREWSDFQLYLRSNLLNYLLHPRWAWVLMAAIFILSMLQTIAELGWGNPDLPAALADLLPFLLIPLFWGTLRLIDWFGKDRLVTTVLGRKHPNGLL